MQCPKLSLISRVCGNACLLLSPLLLLILGIWYANPLLLVQAESTDDDDYYTAGVVEFRPTIAGLPSSELLAENLQAYLDIIESPEAADTEILVFPEGTLNNDLQLTYVPAAIYHMVPCLSGNRTVPFADFFIELSCAARRVRKYLVINVSEKENCTEVPEDPRPCAANGLNVYNTNVVFDREGRVISRYRKVHVYVENKNTTLQPEYGIFDTDFGVRFGHFICFDILFYTPAQAMVTETGLTDFVFTSLFYSELPFLTATQLQMGWAWGNNVNLLAAGASYPQSGTTGTGIYGGQEGVLVQAMVKGVGERKLYKARVRKIRTDAYMGQPQAAPQTKPKAENQPGPQTEPQVTPIQPQLAGIRLMKDPQIHNYNSVLLDVTNLVNHVEELCHGQLCCSLNILAEVPDNTNITALYKYRFGVFDGQRSYEKDEWSDIKVCALYACTTEDSHSCGEVLPTDNSLATVLFKYIHIRGSFPLSEKRLIMPSTVDDELHALTKDKIIWNKYPGSSSYEVDIALAQEHDHLLTFGIYAMYYEKSAAAVLGVAQLLGLRGLVGYVVLKGLIKVLFQFK